MKKLTPEQVAHITWLNDEGWECTALNVNDQWIIHWRDPDNDYPFLDVTHIFESFSGTSSKLSDELEDYFYDCWCPECGDLFLPGEVTDKPDEYATHGRACEDCWYDIEDAIAFEKDPYAYYGLRRSDFY